MKDDIIYLIYRVYSKKERPDHNRANMKWFYGWTNNKSVLKAFFNQRNKSKYQVVKINLEEIGEIFSENGMDPDLYIDYVPLRFASSHEEIHFFTTINELKETEVRIQRYFREKCELVTRDKGRCRLLNILINIDEYYGDALEYIGFIPPEINDLFPSPNLGDNIEDIEDLIEDGYNSYLGSPGEKPDHMKNVPGSMFMDKIYTKILYSVESFIKILKEDL